MSDAPDSAAAVPGLLRFAHVAMNCDWEILIASADTRAAQSAAAAAFEVVDGLEQELSRFIRHSDIARLNDMVPGEPLRLGPAAWECLELAQRVWATTGGAFDVTIGAALRRKSTSNAGQPPIGMQHLVLDPVRRTATRLLEGLVVDLGAIGKGYGVDQATETLREWGVSSALVHSGQSSIFALGSPAPHKDWAITVRNPSDSTAVLGQVHLRDQALSGSGRAVRGPHIIDPRTGAAAQGPVGAWAIAPSTALSDAISTALMVLDSNAAARACCAWSGVAAQVLTDPAAEPRRYGATWPDGVLRPR